MRGTNATHMSFFNFQFGSTLFGASGEPVKSVSEGAFSGSSATAPGAYPATGIARLQVPQTVADLPTQDIGSTRVGYSHQYSLGSIEARHHVIVQGVRLPYYEVRQLRSVPLTALRAHAETVYKTIGPSVIAEPLPVHDHLLADWLSKVHTTHFEPLLLATSPHLEHHAVPHSVVHVHYEGVPVPLYEAYHLRNLPQITLRAHANHLYKTIQGISTPIPDQDELLLEWLIEAQNAHLHPLKAQAVPHAVPHVYHRGIPLPLYELHHLQSMALNQLRAHAKHVHDTIDHHKPLPEEDYLLIEWLHEIHNTHLKRYLARPPTPTSPPSRPTSPLQGTTPPVRQDDDKPISPEELHRVVMDTLLAHGLKATASVMKRESDFGDNLGDASPKSGTREPIVPEGMPDSVVRQYKEARELSNRQLRFVEQCTDQVSQQRTRLERLIERVHDVRVQCGSPTEEEMRAAAHIKEQNAQLEELRLSVDSIAKMESQMKEELGRQEEEKARVEEAIVMRGQNLGQLQAQIAGVEERLEDLRKRAENSDHAQAQRIRKLLLHWDAPQGPKRIAAETFAHVDSNHDGRLEWQNDEICRFVRLIFHYHHVTVPPWPDTVWYELYRLCDLGQSRALDVVESLKFARGCFEAALRALVGG